MPPVVLLRVKGTRALTDPTREIPKGLEILADALPKHADLPARFGITVKHKDGRALDFEVLDAHGNVKKSFNSAISLTFAPHSKGGAVDVVYKYSSINLLRHLGHWLGFSTSPPGIKTFPFLPTVPDDRLMMCSDESAKYVDRPDPAAEPDPKDDDEWSDFASDDEETEEHRIEGEGESEEDEPDEDKTDDREPMQPSNQRDQPSEDETAGDQHIVPSHRDDPFYLTNASGMMDPFGSIQIMNPFESHS